MKASDHFQPRAAAADTDTYLERGFAKGKPGDVSERCGGGGNHRTCLSQPGTASGLSRQTARLSVAAVATQTA